MPPAPFSLALVVAAALAVPAAAGPVVADEDGSPDPAPQARVYTLVGRLVRVDVSHHALTLWTSGTSGREWVLMIDERTRVSDGGRVVGIESLPLGAELLATCQDLAPGRHRADRIGVRRVAPKRTGS